MTILALQYFPESSLSDGATFFKWHEGLSLGNKEIDDHRAILVYLINCLHQDVVRCSAEPRIVKEIFYEFHKHMVVYFSFEKKYLIEIDYFYWEKQSYFHNEIMGKIFEILENPQVGNAVVNLELLNAIKVWLQFPINIDDRNVTVQGPGKAS